MVLITGASGFLGQHLVRYLSVHGVKARALYNKHSPSEELKSLPGITWVRADLLDVFDVEVAMAGITDVYHCAAIVTFEPRLIDEMLHFNPESTANVVNQALVQGIRKLVYVSSVAALSRPGNAEKEITEEQEWGESKYNSAYGISKYLAETEVWRGIGEGLNAVIVNPGIILGAGNWNKGSAQLMKVAYEEFAFYTNGVTSWVDVSDVVKVLAWFMQSDIEGERFIVSAGNFAYREIFTLMADSLNKRPPRIHANSFVAGLAWRWGWLQSALSGRNAVITKETARNAHGVSLYNNQKLLATIPDFSYTGIDQTIKQMAQSFLQSM